MYTVTTSLQFLAASLLIGLGLFLASEAFPGLRRGLLTKASHAIVIVGGLTMIALGGYWIASVVVL
jgi:hypothetical protein